MLGVVDIIAGQTALMYADLAEEEGAGLSVCEFRIYFHLIRCILDGMDCGGQKQIAQACRVGRTTVQKTLYSLRDKGWIEMHESTREGGGQEANKIVLCEPRICKHSGSGRENHGDV